MSHRSIIHSDAATDFMEKETGRDYNAFSMGIEDDKDVPDFPDQSARGHRTLETLEEARLAIGKILAEKPDLRVLVENTEILTLAHLKHATRPCNACDTGTKHFVGRNKLPKGRLGRGGLFVCDGCGDCNSSDLS